MAEFGQTEFGQNLCFCVLAKFGQLSSCTCWCVPLFLSLLCARFAGMFPHVGVCFRCGCVVCEGVFSEVCGVCATFLGVFNIFGSVQHFLGDQPSAGPALRQTGSPDRPSAEPPNIWLFFPPTANFVLSSLCWGSFEKDEITTPPGARSPSDSRQTCSLCKTEILHNQNTSLSSARGEGSEPSPSNGRGFEGGREGRGVEGEELKG